MAIEWDERYISRERKGGQFPAVTVEYVGIGTADDSEALAGLLALAPLTWDGLPRGEPRIRQIGEDTWEGTVEYAAATWGDQQPGPGSMVYRFETSGGTQKIYNSKATRGAYPAGAPSFDKLIGVGSDSVEGCDIVVPVFRWTETWLFSPLSISPAYIRTLFLLTSRVNSLLWRGYYPGEVLFLGAQGGQVGATAFSNWEITFAFAAQPNRAGVVIGSITVAEARGWDYIWVRYQDEVRGTGGDASLVKVAKYAYVEQVYDEADLTLLGIGG